MDNKTLKHPYVEFVGSNATEVTGSANLVRYLNYHILVDYGMRQSAKEEEDYRINSKRHKDIKPKRLDAIIITHPHLDHTGLIPMLYKDGSDCPLYIPQGSKGLLTLMWQDSIKIFETDCDRFGRKMLYSQDDVDNALQHVVEVDRHAEYKINENISFEYINAQHIVKANQICMWLTDGVTTKKLGFTGDFSDYKDRHYLNSLDKLPQIDVLVGESTYSNKLRLYKNKDRKKDMDKLDMAVKRAVETKSKIIMPTFSLDRLQLMLTVLYEMYDGKSPIKILVDSPLGSNVSKLWGGLIDNEQSLWKNIREWDDCYWISDFKDTVHFSAINEPMLTLAGGGFILGGRAPYWVKENLGNSKNCIVFCGYSSEESVAGQIKSGEIKEIKIDGKLVRNKAKTITLNSFSSHADRKHLLDYYTKVQYNKICLVHGEQDGKITFSKDLQLALEQSNRTSKVVCVQKGTKVHF